MPNHVTNILEIKGKGFENVLRFMKTSTGDAGTPSETVLFDFDQIIKMPSELKSRKSPFQQEEGEEKEDLPQIKAELIKRYGFSCWYEWAIHYWGTKWGAYDAEMIKEDIIRFDTAWSGVLKIIILLSRRFPFLTFNYKFCDEDFGNNVGAYSIRQGSTIFRVEPLDGSFEAFELAFSINPDMRSDYKLVDGSYVYLEED